MPVSQTHLPREEPRCIHVGPSCFDTFATSPTSATSMVEVERAFAVFAVRFEVELWDDEGEDSIVGQCVERGVVIA